MKIPLHFLFLCFVFLFSCSRNPVTGKNELQLISEEQEIEIGEQNYLLLQQAQGGDYEAHQQIDVYVKSVGEKLAKVSDRPQLPYEFVVVNNSIPNAWSLPGGKIAIYRGLIMELDNEAELAAVLAHEIVHSAARHGAQAAERELLLQSGISGIGQIVSGHKYEDVALNSASFGAGMIHLKYSRSAELEADAYGIKYMAAAGYNPYAAVTLQEKFLALAEGKRQDWLSGLFATHPPSEERIKANIQAASQYPPGGTLGTDEFKKNMAPLKKAKGAYENLDRGYEALKEKKLAKSLELAQAGIAIEPREGHLFNLKGKALAELHDDRSALAAFNKAIELTANYFDFYLERGLLEKRIHDYASAKRDLFKSLEFFPSAEAHLALGEIALKEGRRLDALRHFQLASESPSTAGLQAREQMTALRQKEQTSNQLTAEGRWISQRELHVLLHNRSMHAVKNTTIVVTLTDRQNHILYRESFFIPYRIPSGGFVSKTLLISAPRTEFKTQIAVVQTET